MRPKTIATLLGILALVFVTLGDSFLPEPLSSASQTTRQSINNFIIGLFPDWGPIDKPQQSEEAIENLEQGN